jgi:hypothetical protein
MLCMVRGSGFYGNFSVYREHVAVLCRSVILRHWEVSLCVFAWKGFEDSR